MNRGRSALGILGAARRTLSRILAPIPDTPRSRVVLHRNRPRALGTAVCHLALLTRSLDRPHQALSLALTAAFLDPTNASVHVAVAEAALTGGRRGIINQPVVGLELTAVADSSLARSAVREALRLDPASVAARRLAVVAEIEGGDYEAAARLLDSTKLPEVEQHLLRARIADESGRNRGAHTCGESRALTVAWQATHRLRPSDHVVRHRLIRHLVQLGDYSSARQVAWPEGPAPVSVSAAELEAAISTRPPQDWLYVAHAELTSVGRVLDAHRAKRQSAEQDAETHLVWHSPTSALIRRMQAVSYLAGPDTAHSTLAANRIMFASDRERRTVNKFAADLRLSAGDIGPARACRAAATTLDPLAEERHRRLLAGAHVLVVGPAPSSRPTGDQLARADVVAVTKRPLDRSLTACPQLVYPTDASARLDLRPEQLCATQTVVLRPSILRSPSHAAPAFAASRVMPAEDANAYLGTRFGVQRILYDLLHYDPAVIELCGVDFFLAPTPYVEGYTDETDRLYQPNDLQPSMSVAPHDYIWDFSFTKTLHEHGHLTVGPEIQSILRLTPGEYLRQLEAVLTST